jgi:hypothetical protein
VLVQKRGNAAVLTRIELVKAIHCKHEISFWNLQPCFERAGVLHLVDVDLCSSRDRLHVRRVVAEVIPSRRVVQTADHINAVCR